MGNHDRVLIVAIVAIVAIVGVLSLRGGGLVRQEALSGYATDPSAAAPAAQAPPEPEPVPFALSVCGNKVCEIGFEDCRSCDADCGQCV